MGASGGQGVGDAALVHPCPRVVPLLPEATSKDWSGSFCLLLSASRGRYPSMGAPKRRPLSKEKHMPTAKNTYDKYKIRQKKLTEKETTWS